MPTRPKSRASSLLAVLLFVSYASAAAAAPLGAGPAGTASASDTARVRRWRQELDFIVQRVLVQHPRPFAFTERGPFDSARAEIERRIPEWDDARLAVESMRMTALLGDGHTLLIGTFPPLGFTSCLPIWLRHFEDGLYLVAAGPEYAGPLGLRVTRVGDVSAAEALERVSSMTSGDNRYTRLDRVPLFFMMPAALQALGISPDADRVTLEVERSPGTVDRVTVAGGGPPEGFPEAFLESEPRFPAGWKSARRAAGADLPRCDQRPEKAWWFEHLAGQKTLYLRMARIDPISQDRYYAEFYRELFAAADSARPEALVIDLRHDHGGNNTILDPLVRGIVQRPWLDREGALYALIDRGTFSAAMNAAVFLEDRTRVTFVGEPTGGRPNHYGDAPEGQTPHFGMLLQVSTLPWFSRDPSDDRAWIAPGIAVPSTFAAWRDGRDAALDAVLDAVAQGTLPERILAASHRAGPEAAVQTREAWRRQHPNPWNGEGGDRLLALASELAEAGDWKSAVSLGEALVRMEPKSGIYWRVLGEAQAAAGNRARSIECLRRVLEINPRAQVARMMLERMGEKP